MRRILSALLGLSIALSCGCSFAPKYTRPEAPVPASWPEGPAYQGAGATDSGTPAATALSWREFFTDQRLRAIIETALNNNRDLRIAALNVETARAMYGIQRAELFPTVDATGRYTRERVAAGVGGVSRATTLEQYNVNLGIASWEIDFFGRIRSLKDRALQEYLASEHAHRAAQILLVSEVANAWLTLAADREKLEIAKYTVETQQSAFKIINRRAEIGTGNNLDVNQARTRVDAARSDVALYTQMVAQDQNALDLLVGSPVQHDLLAEDLKAIDPMREVSARLPSDVLLGRPDILQAESMLKATNADVGAARAAFFPRISLTSWVGSASKDLTGLFSAGAGTWSYAPQLVLPIFDARLWSALKASKVQGEVAVANYEKSIQTAFREVADSLAVRGTVEEQLSAQDSLVGSSSEAYRLANSRYERGIDNFLTVLDAQRSWYSAQLGLVSTRYAKVANQVRLYAVLGGGVY